MIMRSHLKIYNSDSGVIDIAAVLIVFRTIIHVGRA